MTVDADIVTAHISSQLQSLLRCVVTSDHVIILSLRILTVKH